MEMHQLRYFVAVAETGSFSRAAERCHVSQPSLSQQIMKLEARLGQRLFDRLGRRVVLTDVGRLLLDHATAILAEVEQVERQIREATHTVQGKLAIGAIPTVAPYLLPSTIELFLRRYPEVEITIQEEVTHQLLAATIAGEIDLAIVALPVSDSRLRVEPLFTEPLLLAMPRGHRLAKRKRVRIEDLKKERFILLSEMHCLGEQVSNFCRQHEFEPRVACRSAQLPTILSLIAAGQGVSLIPAMAKESDKSRRRVYRPLSDPIPSRTIAVVRHRLRHQTPAMRQFVQLLKKRAGDARASAPKVGAE
ncbi:LysR family transcriptional regulator [Pyrinomonas methylaliphatogenes]|jgi:LysR family hydrogen peroxide-inducible transcriptional activator|uniref:Transcriptional regulator n=1 Tax=Pyrinomonas methylaliphatogenes TaxID=454194 RepID=A0A0B6X105_9BACT|nr:LysR substrate-binding domain-containing protein [Pyrinomonas methylaliphatogenes]MBX5477937.1 LysR family transcriptional regulator [Pyrinomonas methylaliphatogenes]CDM66657.1 transcriptional regulator [Pyrinomonas methylaliphatogenes]